MSTILLLRRIASPLLALAGLGGACALTATAAFAAPVTDNFESYAVGSFPSPAWSDFGSFFPTPPGNPDPVLPSMTVVATTDAFGHATQALQNVDVVATSKGVYAPLDGGSLLSVSADVRTLRYSDSNPALVMPWEDQGASVGMFTANLQSAPFLSIYASSSTKGWRLGYSGDAETSPDLDDYDLGAAAVEGRWYRVELDLNRQTGTFHSMITDIASGTVVVDRTITYANYQPSYDAFDSILFGPVEDALPGGITGPGAATIANITQLDNVNVAAVPEPRTTALMLAGIALLAAARKVRLGRGNAAAPG